MELSNFEKLELDKIARGLEEDDPRLATLMSMEDLGRIRWKYAIRGALVGLSGLALLLASPASSYMTGAVIPVDGGASAR